MNMQDLVNAFRRLQGDITFVTVGTTDGLLVSSANHRMGLVIGAPQSARITITTAGIAVADQGFDIYPGQPPLWLSLWTHGNLVARQFRAISAGTPQLIGIIESAGEFDCNCELWQQANMGSGFNGTNSPLYGPGSGYSQPGPTLDPRMETTPRLGY